MWLAKHTTVDTRCRMYQMQMQCKKGKLQVREGPSLVRTAFRVGVRGSHHSILVSFNTNVGNITCPDSLASS